MSRYRVRGFSSHDFELELELDSSNVYDAEAYIEDNNLIDGLEWGSVTVDSVEEIK